MRDDNRGISKVSTRSAESRCEIDRLKFLPAEGERKLHGRAEEHLPLHLDYSPQKARMEIGVI